jgi:carboxyl-terminal processing protease
VTDKPDKPDHAREDCYRYWHRPLHIFEGVPNFGFANGVVNVTLAAVAKAVGASQPVEFRKDGIPVDPSPMVGRKRKPEGSRMMKRKTSLILLGAAAGVAVTLIATPPRIALDGARAQATDADTYRQLSLFGDVFERLRADYVEKPDDGKLIESAINGMLAGLDPHSSYMDSKSFRDLQVQTRGEFGGLGIEVTMEDGLIRVVAPIDETPAAKAGIMANDIITHLDDEPVQGLTLNQAVEKMRGPENSKIKLKIMRKGQDKPVEVTITRARIQVRSVRSRLEGDDVSFIRVTQFNEQTTDGLKKAISDLSAQARDRLKAFVIDLRNNPGGLLDQAISVSDAFLEKGEIASTRGRNAEETQRFNARSGDLTKGKPLIVLINGGSASASEIVAGALQDHRRATVIGTRSFGKGSVQTIIPLGSGNGGALRLTTARYFTPSGRSIQAKGISPDIEVLQEVPEELKARTDTRGEASLRGHLKTEGDEQTGSQSYIPPDPKDDKALHTALDLIRGIQKNSACLDLQALPCP